MYLQRPSACIRPPALPEDDTSHEDAEPRDGRTAGLLTRTGSAFFTS